MPADDLKVTTTFSFTDERIRNLLVGAFEGGSNYWYAINALVYGPWPKSTFRQNISAELTKWASDCYLLPFVDGCAVAIVSTEDSADEDERTVYRLDRSSMQRGLNLMAEKFPKHFQDLVMENDDAETADVFLQLCLFGDIIYG